MPLIHGKSKKAFQHNVEEEIEDHPGPDHRAQNLAIAYSVKRKAQRQGMSDGGFPIITNTQTPESNAQYGSKLAIDQKGKAPKRMSAGGYAEDGDLQGEGLSADAEDSKNLNQHLAAALEGIQDSIVDRIMHQRSVDYSEEGRQERGDNFSHEARMSLGGRVANGGEDDLDELADSRPNNFDDLALRDDLESTHSGASAGDFLGGEQEDQDREDIVARILSQRRMKKQHNPVPA